MKIGIPECDTRAQCQDTISVKSEHDKETDGHDLFCRREKKKKNNDTRHIIAETVHDY